MGTAIFTIASRNYFAHVDVLMASLERTNPGYSRFAVCVDEVDESFMSQSRNYSVVTLEELNLPDFRKMAFRYTILELNTAVKPWAIEMLLEKFDHVIYLDPDIAVYSEFTAVEEAFRHDAQVVFTPHFTHLWQADGKRPDEVSILRAGAYNLGFLAVAHTEDVRKMLRWWRGKLEYQCVVDLDGGLFVDQKWMDLVPGLFDRVAIVRDDGYNVAYWNLSHRKITRRGEGYLVNGSPLVFFHFSGYDVKRPAIISRHQDRFDMADLGDGGGLFAQYAAWLKGRAACGYERYAYSYGHFSDGSPILDFERQVYRNDRELEETCGVDPFQAHEAFHGPRRQRILRRALCAIWDERLDVRRQFGSPGVQFVEWAKGEFAMPDDMRCIFPEVYSSNMSIKGERVKPMTLREWLTASKAFLPRGVYSVARNVFRTLMQ